MTYEHYNKEFLSVEKILLSLSEMLNNVTFFAYPMCWKAVMPIWLQTKLNEKNIIYYIKSVNGHRGVLV